MIKRVQPLNGTEISALTPTEALDPSTHQVPQLPDALPPCVSDSSSRRISMPSTTETNAQQTTPKKVLTAVHNLPNRARSQTLLGQPARPRAPGKENIPPGENPTSKTEPAAPRRAAHLRRRPAPLLLGRTPTSVQGLSMGSHASPAVDQDVFSHPHSLPVEPHSPQQPSGTAQASKNANKWAAKDGKIVIKVWVPSTDDIWKLRVPEDVRLESFRTRVAAKVGFDVSFSALVCGTLRTLADDDAFREWVAGRVVNGRNSLLTAHRLALA